MIDLTKAKQHLRVDHSDEDQGIANLISAAEDYLVDIGVNKPEPRPASIDQAVLLLIGHWFANREAVLSGTVAVELPLAFDALVAPHRNIMGGVTV